MWRQKKGLIKKMLKTINKLDVTSLNILEVFKQRHDLMTVMPQWINDPTIRYLLDLDVLSVEVFPINDHGYYLTDLGRYLLDRELEFKELYPEILCQILQVRFWQSYTKFIQKKKSLGKSLQFLGIDVLKS